MSAAMDLRISADSDIKRLREMVQKLEEKNAGLKIGETSNSVSNEQPVQQEDDMNIDPSKRVAVKLNLEDVPLLDLKDVDSGEEEDSWLYTSPQHPPTPAQKSVSPYKYLKHNIDVSNLNKVRGSLMAKLESIASQEDALARHDHPPSPPRSRSSSSHMDENHTRPRMSDHDDGIDAIDTGTFVVQRKGSPRRASPRSYGTGARYRAWENLAATYDDNSKEEADFNDAPIVRRRGTPSAVQRIPSSEFYDDDDDDEEDLGPVKPRGSGHIDFGLSKPRSRSRDSDNMGPARPRSNPSQDDFGPAHPRGTPVQEDLGPIRPRGSAGQNYSAAMLDDDDIEFNSAPVRRRGTGNSASSFARMPEDDMLSGAVRPRSRPSPGYSPQDDSGMRGQVRSRGSPAQFAVNVPDDDDMEGISNGPVRRRTPRESAPRTNTGSPQLAWQGEPDDIDSSPVRPRRRPVAPTPMLDGDEDAELDNQAPVVRRRGTPTNKPSDDNLVTAAVRRRQGSPQDSQVKPRGSGVPSPQYGSLPTPTRRGTPSKLRASEDAEIRRRSLPQVPSSRSSRPPSSYSDHQVTPRGTGSNSPKMRVRSASPGGRLGQAAHPVVPRGSKLAAPRRIPAPSSTYYSNEIEDAWQDGCY